MVGYKHLMANDIWSLEANIKIIFIFVFSKGLIYTYIHTYIHTYIK